MLSGVLPVYKERGLVSKDVSRRIERALRANGLGAVKLGHVGTLDPMAEGMLPLLFGSATRLQDFLLELPKSYTADITFGYATDSLDADGQIVSEMSFDHVDAAAINQQLEKFVGDIQQVPPVFSAVKTSGKPLYEYARRGAADQIPAEALKPRPVHIFHIKLVQYVAPVATIEVVCSKGTYIRSIVRDLAIALGTCGTMTRLVRTKSAGLDVGKSIRLADIEGDIHNLAAHLISAAECPVPLPRLKIAENRVLSRLRDGLPQNLEWQNVVENSQLPDQKSSFSSFVNGQLWLLLDADGKAFGLGQITALQVGNDDESRSKQLRIQMKRGL